MNKLNLPSNLIQKIKLFLQNMEDFLVLSNSKVSEISNYLELEIHNINKKYFNTINFSTSYKKYLPKKGINKQDLEDKIQKSANMEIHTNDRLILINSYYKSLELAKLFEIYSNLCINIFIKNFSYEDILHAKTNIIMKEIYEKISFEKDLLIT